MFTQKPNTNENTVSVNYNFSKNKKSINPMGRYNSNKISALNGQKVSKFKFRYRIKQFMKKGDIIDLNRLKEKMNLNFGKSEKKKDVDVCTIKDKISPKVSRLEKERRRSHVNKLDWKGNFAKNKYWNINNKSKEKRGLTVNKLNGKGNPNLNTLNKKRNVNLNKSTQKKDLYISVLQRKKYSIPCRGHGSISSSIPRNKLLPFIYSIFNFYRVCNNSLVNGFRRFFPFNFLPFERRIGQNLICVLMLYKLHRILKDRRLSQYKIIRAYPCGFYLSKTSLNKFNKNSYVHSFAHSSILKHSVAKHALMQRYQFSSISSKVLRENIRRMHHKKLGHSFWHYVYKSIFFKKFINSFMRSGKKEKMEHVACSIFSSIKMKTRRQPIFLFNGVVASLQPMLQHRYVTRYGKSHPVPIVISSKRRLFSFFSFLKDIVKERVRVLNFEEVIVRELIAAANHRGRLRNKVFGLHRTAYHNKINLKYLHKRRRRNRLFS